KMNGLADINILPSHAIFTLPPKTRRMSSSNQALSNCPQLLVNSLSQLLSQMLSQLLSQSLPQSSSQLFSQSSSQPFLQSLLQAPLQVTSQIPLQTNNFSLQPLNNFFLNLSNVSSQMSPNVLLQIPLQMLPNILLQIPPLYILFSQLLPNISLQPYFILFLIFPNLQPLYASTNNLMLRKLSATYLKSVPKLDEFLTKIDEAENTD
ncbi:19483_t:CDS:1, partial [Racocetra persica]